jgi:ankyrin repeat protein
LYALSYESSNSFQYLINNNADVTLVNSEGENIIHSIVYSGEIDRMEGLLNVDNINLQTKEGVTPLLLAILLDKYDIAHYLINNGADVNIPDEDMNLPIHVASNAGSIELVSVFIKKGVDLFSKTKKGNLPIALAANNGHHDVVKSLFKNMNQLYIIY